MLMAQDVKSGNEAKSWRLADTLRGPANNAIDFGEVPPELGKEA